MFSKGNIEDFRVSNVNGEFLMTLMDQGRGEAVIFDNHFEVRDLIKLDHFNSHELNFVENGTRALLIRGNGKDATREMGQAIGWDEDRLCHAGFDRFEELDVTDNFKKVFGFSTFGNVGLDESTFTEHDLQTRCGKGSWDFM